MSTQTIYVTSSSGANQIKYFCHILIDESLIEGEITAYFDNGLRAGNSRVTKNLVTFLLEDQHGHRYDLLQKCFRLQIVKDSARINVQSTTSFSNSFELLFQSKDFIRFVDFLPSTPHFESVKATSFYVSSQKSISLSKSQNPVEVEPTIVINETFAKQDHAFQRYDQLTPEERSLTKIFTFERFQTGKRRFLLMDMESFFHSYFYLFHQSESPHHRCNNNKHVYEIIRDTFPCRLYFDLEYSKVHNPLAEGDRLTEKFIHLILWKIYELFQLTLDWNNVLVLDSTTDKKFSKHIIIHLCGHDQIEYLLPNNVVIQEILQLLLREITEMSSSVTEEDEARVKETPDPHPFEVPAVSPFSSPSSTAIDISYPSQKSPQQLSKPKSDYQDLWLLNEDGQRHFIVDLGVYSRNRAFRLFDSCKYGKEQSFRLLASDKKRYSFQYSQMTSPVLMKMELLNYSWIIPQDLLLSQPSFVIRKNREVEEERTNEKDSSSYLSFSSFLPYLNIQKYRIISISKPSLPFRPYSSFFLSTSQYPLSMGSIASNLPSSSSFSCSCSSWKSQALLRSHHPRQESPFPELDRYLSRTIACRGGVEGILQEWMILVKANGDFPIYKIRYQIARNRYCERIGRAHKSNGIYWEINLMTRECTQHCWDPDCKGFQSTVLLLPELVIPAPTEVERTIKEKCTNNIL